jgi:hypothetical protein
MSRAIPEPTGLLLMVLFGLLAGLVWSLIGPTVMSVFSALVQTGIPTRLVLLSLFFACGFGLFAFRTANQVWYGHAICGLALAAAWNLLGMLAVQVQSVDVLALVAAGCVLMHGLVNIQGMQPPGGVRQ